MRTVSLVVAVLMMLVGVNAKAELGNDLPAVTKKTEATISLAEVANQFVIGKTTYEEVTKLLGEPKTSPAIDGMGNSWVAYNDKVEPQKSINDVPVVGVYTSAIAGVLKIDKGFEKVTTVQLCFDKNKILSYKVIY
jgi:hypothetical protein